MANLRRLSEGEVIALRDCARDLVLTEAGERLKNYKGASDPQKGRDEATERMLGAAEVYGACRNVELRFSKTKGIPTSFDESTDVEFSDRALAYMATLRDEIRGGLEGGRGTCEVNIDSSPRETFLLFVLDGICGNDDQEAAERLAVTSGGEC